jgi:hypothetical protein
MSISTTDNDFLNALENAMEAAQPPTDKSHCAPIGSLFMEDAESTVDEDERRWFIKTARRSYDFNKKSAIIRNMH